jgi:SAM-dependent methyltransferase
VPVAQTLARHARVTGVDLSPVQIERARARVPEAEFICADMATLVFPPGSFDAVLALYSIIHLPVAEQPALLEKISGWLAPGGLFLATLGSGAWTGTEQDWLGVGGAEMYWSHADAPSYRRWLADAGFDLLHDEFIPEGQGSAGHQLFHARIQPHTRP